LNFCSVTQKLNHLLSFRTTETSTKLNDQNAHRGDKGNN